MKKCSCCGEEKSLDSFTKKNSTKDGLNHSCSSCTKLRSKNHYDQNKKQYLDRNKKVKFSNREKIWNLLCSSKCTDCGEENPLFLEFDHLKDKTYNVSSMIGSCRWNQILKEISKCDIVCCHCHKLRTYQRLNTWYYQQWLKQKEVVSPVATNELKE